MISFKRPTADLHEEAMRRYDTAKAEQNEANIEYVAMMADVELPDTQAADEEGEDE